MKNVENIHGAFMCILWLDKSPIKKKGVAFKEIYIGDDPNKMSEMLKKSNGMKTVPQIFVDGKHIGGNQELQTLEKEGKLNSLLGI